MRTDPHAYGPGASVTLSSAEPYVPAEGETLPPGLDNATLAAMTANGGSLAAPPEWMNPAPSAPADPGPRSAADLAADRAAVADLLNGPSANATPIRPHTLPTPDAAPAPGDPNGWNERERRAA